MRETEATVVEGGRRIAIDWPDGARQHLSARWLYDHADEVRDPASGQRRHGALELADARIEAAHVAHDRLTLRFAAGERGLPLARLRTEDTTSATELWENPEAFAGLPPIAFADYLADDAALAEALRRVVSFGLVLLSGAGDDPEAVRQAVARFGFVRETNYGFLFDVRVEASPGNLAYTERALDLHTDNPYRDPVPTLQLLHAIRADDGGGGETTFVDGFAHAEALRREAPAHFEILARQPVRFTFAEAGGARWSARVPILQLDAAGALAAVRLNHRSLDLAPDEADRLEPWYEAYLDLCRRLHAPGAAFGRRLATGDLVIFDNRRILHGRQAFQAGGARWLRGAYADVDGLQATLARLRSALAD